MSQNGVTSLPVWSNDGDEEAPSEIIVRPNYRITYLISGAGNFTRILIKTLNLTCEESISFASVRL